MAPRYRHPPIDLTQKTTLVTFLLDKSGSMASVRKPTIDAFNAYLDGLREEPTGILFSFIQFDTVSTDVINRNDPIDSVRPLTETNYIPRGQTPLVDAAYKTIEAVENAVAKRNDPKVVICIQTDGQENASREYTMEQLNDLIREKTALGWQFNFMGAGIDAYAQARQMGISGQSTVSYDVHSPNATKSAFFAQAQNTQSFAAGQSASTNYSDAQRLSAGDKHWPNGDAFTTNSAHTDSLIAQMKEAKARAELPRKKIVDDIDL